MANKENLSPHSAASRNLAHDGSGPFVHASSSNRNQAHSPIFGLSPSKNPVLNQQRDHSACRRTDLPLKVRKTRENLREPVAYTNVLPPLPPCVHAGHTAAEVVREDAHDQIDTSESTLVDAYEDDNAALRALDPAPMPGRMQRHKSVSRRMLSKVKEGISQRSRSSQSMRPPAGSDTGLMRKLSGKIKQSSEEQPRMRSFEISRESIDSLVEDGIGAKPTASSNPSIPMEYPTGSTPITTPPPSSPLTPKALTHTRQYSGRLLSPSPEPRAPSDDPTPRPTLKTSTSGFGRESKSLQVTIPFVNLSVKVDRNSIDVNLAGDMWVAVEGTVRSWAVEASTMHSARTAPLRKRSLDAIIVVTQDVLAFDTKAAHKCIVELCSRLNVAGDRLAVLCARMQQTGTSAVNCECEQLHPLQGPSLTRLFERLGIAPAAVNTIFEANWQSLPDSLQCLAESGLRKDRAQAFVISRTPDLLVQIIDHLVQWPTHALKIGLTSEHATVPVPHTRHNWAVQIKGDADENVEIFDNMIKDLRHGCPGGCISSLRMCYKPRQGCQILEVLGQKASRDLRLGQRFSLFLKVHVPRVDTSRSDAHNEATETDSLFAELESIVGTLETNLVHVEARYRHSLFPSESVVTVRQICSIRRPKSDTRWSTVGRENDVSSPERVHVALAQFLAMHYPPARALRMINRWVMLPSECQVEEMQQVRKYLELQINASDGLGGSSTSVSPDSTKPSVIVTDIESEPHVTATPCKIEAVPPGIPSASRVANMQLPAEVGALSPKSSIAAARTISVAKTTTALTIAGTPHIDQSLDQGEDSARQLWRHIRHHSLSAKQLADMTPTKLQQLEANDDTIRVLRHRALSNKRSVGVETLKGWKWEERAKDGGAEAPWL